MIPGESIARIVPMPGVPDGVELVEVRSKHGGNSRLSFKSFDQGDCRSRELSRILSGLTKNRQPIFTRNA